MFFKRPAHRIFDYTPQFYNPEEDEERKEKERKKRRLGFRRNLKAKRKRGNALIYALLVLLVIYAYLKLTGAV